MKFFIDIWLGNLSVAFGTIGGRFAKKTSGNATFSSKGLPTPKW
jgi:hypothetical protein